MIEMGMGQLASRVKLHYVFPDSKQLIKISDFEAFNVYYDYLKKGGRLINCQECGKLVLVNNNRGRYCKDCQKQKQKQWEKESKERAKNNQLFLFYVDFIGIKNKKASFRKIVINVDTTTFVIAYKNKFPKNTMVQNSNDMF